MQRELCIWLQENEWRPFANDRRTCSPWLQRRGLHSSFAFLNWPTLWIAPTSCAWMIPSLNASNYKTISRSDAIRPRTSMVYFSLMQPGPIFASILSFAVIETRCGSENRDWLREAQILPFSSTSNTVCNWVKTTSALGCANRVQPSLKINIPHLQCVKLGLTRFESVHAKGVFIWWGP